MGARRVAVGWAALLALSGCVGHNAVDPNAGDANSYSFGGATAKGEVFPVADRRLAGNASAPYLDGSGGWQLHSLTGQVVVLNYWASNCVPCVTEAPAFDRFFRANQARGVSFVGIDTKEVSRSPAKAFVADNDISYPIVFDQSGRTALQLGRIPATFLPASVLVDKRGRIAAVYVGAVQAGDLQLAVSTLVAEV